MSSLLIHSVYWNIVSGKVKKESLAGVTEKIKWDTEDEKTLATIILSVKPSHYYRDIKNTTSSSEAWQKLQVTYQPKGPIQKVSLYKRLVSLQMKDSVNVMLHVKTFTEIVEKLSELGIEIQKELLSIMLLCSLAKDFENFVIAMETRDNIPSLNFLKQKLLEDADRRKVKIEE